MLAKVGAADRRLQESECKATASPSLGEARSSPRHNRNVGDGSTSLSWCRRNASARACHSHQIQRERILVVHLRGLATSRPGVTHAQEAREPAAIPPSQALIGNALGFEAAWMLT